MNTTLLAIQSILANIAAWRAKMARRYPRDDRNRIAAALLHELARQPAASVPAAVLLDLQSYDTATLCAVTEDIAKRVAFRTVIGTPGRAVVGSLVDLLDQVMDEADERADEAAKAIAAVFPSSGEGVR